MNLDQSPQETPERALVPKPPLVARTAGCSVLVCSAGARRSSERAGAGRGASGSSAATPETVSLAPKPARPAARPAPRLAARATAATTGRDALLPARPWQHARTRQGSCKTPLPRAPRRRTWSATSGFARQRRRCAQHAGRGGALSAPSPATVGPVPGGWGGDSGRASCPMRERAGQGPQGRLGFLQVCVGVCK